MHKPIALALALALAPFAASADALSYTFVEGGWSKVHVDEEDLGSPEADGAYLRGSYDIARGVNVFGGASRVSNDFNVFGTNVDVDLTQYELGLGYHQSMSERVDFIAELAYARLELEAEATGLSESEDLAGGRGAIGVRGQLADSLEALLKVNYYAGGDFDDETFTGTLGAQFKLNPTWGITAELEHGEMISSGGDTRYGIGVRASF